MKNLFRAVVPPDSRSSLRRCVRRSLIALVLGCGVLLLAFLTTKFTIRGSLDALYLLKGSPGWVFEVKDTILLGEYERVIMKVELGGLFSPVTKDDGRGRSVPEFSYSWDQEEGQGYIKSFFPDGTRLIMSFSRFVDSEGGAPQGVFVGGGLPYYEYENGKVALNETGMAFFDGSRWRHLWCNANESLLSGVNPGTILYPSQWTFRGSRVLHATNRRIILGSAHETILDGVPVRMDRYALYRAGEHYFILLLKFRNIGRQPVSFMYIYGDEPWVGNYGSSLGNVGWVRDRLVYYEGAVDPKRYTHTGMYDHGNRMISHEQGAFSGTANFIEWLEDKRPDLVYFSNRLGSYAEESERVPLKSVQNRVLMLQWGPKPLAPGEMEVIILAVGMALQNKETGMPEKPTVRLNLDEFAFLLADEGRRSGDE